MTRRIVVVGGGITGLTVAYRLSRQEEPADFVLLEAGAEAGGKVSSRDVGGLTLEAGPDSILARKPWVVDLARELGFADEDLLPAASVPTHIWTRRRGLVRFPSGPFGISTEPMELLRWPGMSMAAKVRAAGDLLMPRRGLMTDESIGELLRRRIGRKATAALIGPLLGGLFGGDIDQLSVRATLPELAEWEREHGSLMRGARAAVAKRSPGVLPAPPTFVQLRGGLRSLTDRLASKLGSSIRLTTAVHSIERDSEGFIVRTGRESVGADAVVLTTPAPVSAVLLKGIAPEAATLLGRITHTSTAVVLLVYPEGTNSRLPDSAGFVAPAGTLPMRAVTVVSKKWPHVSFCDRAVLRCFVGGSSPEAQALLARPDNEIVDAVSASLPAVLGLPRYAQDCEVVRWNDSMPQYGVGHLDLVQRIEDGLPAGLAVAGSAYRGAGLPDCVRQANDVAELLGAESSVGITT